MQPQLHQRTWVVRMRGWREHSPPDAHKNHKDTLPSASRVPNATTPATTRPDTTSPMPSTTAFSSLDLVVSRACFVVCRTSSPCEHAHHGHEPRRDMVEPAKRCLRLTSPTSRNKSHYPRHMQGDRRTKTTRMPRYPRSNTRRSLRRQGGRRGAMFSQRICFQQRNQPSKCGTCTLSFLSPLPTPSQQLHSPSPLRHKPTHYQHHHLQHTWCLNDSLRISYSTNHGSITPTPPLALPARLSSRKSQHQEGVQSKEQGGWAEPPHARPHCLHYQHEEREDRAHKRATAGVLPV